MMRPCRVPMPCYRRSIHAIKITCQASVAGQEAWGWGLDDGPRGNDTVLGDDDDPVSDVVARAVGLLDVVHVHEPRAVADARVLVHDHAIELDVPADAELRPIASRRRVIVASVEVGAKEH